VNHLVDTNVISELRKSPERRNAGVSQWFADVDAETLFISVLVIAELRKGIAIKRAQDSRQALALQNWLDGLVAQFSDRIVQIDHAIAERWGEMQSIRTFPVVDGLLAATADVRSMTLVTRNVGDLADWPKPGLLLNPFS